MTSITPTTFTLLVECLKQIQLVEKRKEYDGYFEFVMETKDLVRIYPLLESYFGVPFKPAGVAPNDAQKDIAKRYGGVQKQQTLYYAERAGLISCAMIWPWSDNLRATVKLAEGKI